MKLSQYPQRRDTCTPIIHNSEAMETIQVSINGWMDKESVSTLKRKKPVIFNNMDEL
jgi:hypothetical protein